MLGGHYWEIVTSSHNTHELTATLDLYTKSTAHHPSMEQDGFPSLHLLDTDSKWLLWMGESVFLSDVVHVKLMLLPQMILLP